MFGGSDKYKFTLSRWFFGCCTDHQILDLRISILPLSCIHHLSVLCHAKGTPPPWILKSGVLEISGQRLISLNGCVDTTNYGTWVCTVLALVLMQKTNKMKAIIFPSLQTSKNFLRLSGRHPLIFPSMKVFLKSNFSSKPFQLKLKVNKKEDTCENFWGPKTTLISKTRSLPGQHASLAVKLNQDDELLVFPVSSSTSFKLDLTSQRKLLNTLRKTLHSTVYESGKLGLYFS